jgi:membrane protease YdiL (CAAX protease family)
MVALVGFAIGLFLSAGATAIAESITGYRPSSGSALPVGVLAANVIGLWVGMGGAAVYASRTGGTGSLARDFGWRIGGWWDLPMGAAVGLGCQFVLIPLLYLPFESADKSISRQLGQPAQRDTAAAHGSVAAVVLLIILLAVGAPLVEELFFRGLLLRSLLGLTRPPVAIVVDALVFGLAHYERLQFAGLAAFGAVLAFMAWRTGRLAPCVAAHMAFNTAAVIVALGMH